MSGCRYHRRVLVSEYFSRARKSVGVGLWAAVIVAALTLVGSALPPGLPGAAPSATAACPDVQVVFARGRYESPGPGVLGNAFINSVQNKAGGKNVGSYAVKYPADTEVDIGANDMSGHVQSMINNCPNTRLVLGGYSLGAAVTDVVLAVPFSAFGFDNPLPAGSEDHIAAVALFGNGSAWAGPITNFSPVYNDRTIELCHGADPICNPADPNTWKENWPQHLANAYIQAGMADQAADFVVGRL